MKTSKLPEKRENANHKGAIGLSFKSDWLKKGSEFFFNRSLSEVKQKQSHITFDSQLKFLHKSKKIDKAVDIPVEARLVHCF